MATECGVEVCAPVHDAVLICAPLEQLDVDVAAMRRIMTQAAAVVLDGFPLGTTATLVRYPNRHMDERGTVMWTRVTRLVKQQATEQVA
jgi:DNA polymerase I